MMYQELAKKFIDECVNPERNLSIREVNLIDSFAIYLQSHATQQAQADICLSCQSERQLLLRCPKCGAIDSVKCDAGQPGA